MTISFTGAELEEFVKCIVIQTRKLLAENEKEDISDAQWFQRLYSQWLSGAWREDS